VISGPTTNIGHRAAGHDHRPHWNGPSAAHGYVRGEKVTPPPRKLIEPRVPAPVGDHLGPQRARDATVGTVFERVAPVIPVRDLDAALDRYQRLGFTTHAYPGDARYGFADRDSVSLHLSEWHDHDPKRTGAAVYLYVTECHRRGCRPRRMGTRGSARSPEPTLRPAVGPERVRLRRSRRHLAQGRLDD
jgi:hypothetical protein